MNICWPFCHRRILKLDVPLDVYKTIIYYNMLTLVTTHEPEYSYLVKKYVWQVYMNSDFIFLKISYGIKLFADAVIFWSTLKKTFNSYFERNTILQKNFSLNQQQVFFPYQKRTWHIKHCKAKLHLYNYVTLYDSVSEIILLYCTSCSHVALNYFKAEL